jgi:hypothetical protein
VRAAAASLALALVLCGCAREQRAQPARWRLEGFAALWPERDGDAAWAACARARRTKQQAWRADPGRLAPRYARRVFGWRRPRLVGARTPFYVEIVPARPGGAGVSVMMERFFARAGARDCLWIIGVRPRGGYGRF